MYKRLFHPSELDMEGFTSPNNNCNKWLCKGQDPKQYASETHACLLISASIPSLHFMLPFQLCFSASGSRKIMWEIFSEQVRHMFILSFKIH